MQSEDLPIGKLPAEKLRALLSSLPTNASDVVIGPGIGLDCAVVESPKKLLVLKSDPITFTSDSIGWYLVHINLNDLATTGAIPRWLMVVMLLPEENASRVASEISTQLQEVCRNYGINIIGGHTEITHGLDRPILVGTLIGEVDRCNLISPKGAEPGDRLLLTKGVPIEAVSIIGRDFPERLRGAPAGLSSDEIQEAINYLYDPGISIYRDARTAIRVGGVHAMHDPTEGGIYTALWELAEACQHSLSINLEHIPIPPLAQRICQALKLDPFGAIASGALLLAVTPEKSDEIQNALHLEGIACAEIGEVCTGSGPPAVWTGIHPNKQILPKPIRDEIGKLFD